MDALQEVTQIRDGPEREGGERVTCGCEATINESDIRAPIWKYVFGKTSFPLRHPVLTNMGAVVGLGYEGDASALTEEQKTRLIEAMTEKFHIPVVEVTKVLETGVIPIRAEGVSVSICERHVRAMI
jgi:hypothetical protein